jgi:peptidoglycan/LPS O-acetylase OafA/YrhL
MSAATSVGADRKITNLQALRAIAILLVIFRHILVFQWGSQKPSHDWRDIFLPGDGGVDVFFVISGFVMVEATRRMFRRRGAPASFLARRVTRIYPPYWCYSGALFVVYLVKPDWLHRIALGKHIDILPSFLLWPTSTEPLLGQAWSLIHEVYFYVVFALLLLFRRQLLPWALVAWGVVVLVGRLVVLNSSVSNSPLLQLVFNPLTLEFIAGATIALWIERRRPHAGGWSIFALGAAGFALVAVLSGFRWHHSTWDSAWLFPWVRLACFGLPGALLVYGAVMAEVQAGSLMPRLLTSIGNASYSTYLNHVMVIGLWMKVWPTDAPLTSVPEMVLLGSLMITSCLIAGGLSYQLLEQPLLRMTKPLVARASRRSASPGRR